MGRMFTGATGRVFMLLCLMHFIMYIDRVNISVAGPVIKGEMGLTNTQLGFALSAFGVCYAFLQIVNGYLGDRFGPRKGAVDPRGPLVARDACDGFLHAGSTHWSHRAYLSVWVKPAPSQPLHVR